MKDFLAYSISIDRIILDNLEWTDFQNIGIACIAIAYSNGSIATILPDSKELKDIIVEMLWTDSPLIGFNSHRFSDKVLSYNGIPDFHNSPHGFKYNLATLAEANGMERIMSDVDAQKAWHEGDSAKVQQHTLRDATIIRRLWQLLVNGRLIDPNNQVKLKMSPNNKPKNPPKP